MSDAGLTRTGQGRPFAIFWRLIRHCLRLKSKRYGALNVSDLSASELRDIGLIEGRITHAAMRDAEVKSQSSLMYQIGQRR